MANLDRELIVARLLALMAASERGDIATIAKFLTEDVIYAGGTWKLYPLRNPRQGRDACIDLLKNYYIYYEALGSKIDEILFDGERVAVLRTTRLRNRGSGKSAEVRICNFLRFRDGLIAEYSEFPDTAAVATLDE